MEKVNTTVKIYTQIITFLVIWAVALFITDFYTSFDLKTALFKIPQAISGYVGARLIFIHWLWRWKIFNGWFVKIPNLQGTWKGQLKSNWVDSTTGKSIEAIEVALVIKQTFSNISCTFLTNESESHCISSNIIELPNHDLNLVYSYTNRPKVAHRTKSEIHDGSSMLKIIRKPEKRLEGEYWTNRRTGGEIDLTFDSEDLIEKFHSLK